MTFLGNEYDRRELAGAFGDLGTLVPFVVGYLTVNRLDPQGVLLGSAWSPWRLGSTSGPRCPSSR